MLNREQAAKYLVVAWCKEWTVGAYLDAVAEDKVSDDLRKNLAPLEEEFPWLPHAYKVYSKGTRDFVAGAYPKLSAWLWAQSSDADRLKCAPQIERLVCRGVRVGYVSSADKSEMRLARRDERAAADSYRLMRDSFKSNQRSAWNVCKG